MMRFQLVVLFSALSAFAQASSLAGPILPNIFPYTPTYRVFEEFDTDTNGTVQPATMQLSSTSVRDTTGMVGGLICATVTDTAVHSTITDSAGSSHTTTTQSVNNNHFRNTTGIDVQQFTDSAFWAAYIGPATQFVTLGARWVTLYNGSAGRGVTYNIVTIDTNITFPTVGSTAVNVTMTGKWDVADTSVTVPAGQYTCYKCTITVHTSAKALGGLLTVIENTYDQRVWVSSGVGIVLSNKPRVIVSIPGYPPQTMLGAERRLRSPGFTAVHDPLTNPSAIALSQVYPNPVTGAAMMTLDLPSSTHTLMRVFDLQGRCVRTLTDGVMPAGTTAFLLDGAGLAPGMYVMTVEAMGKCISKKFNVVK